MYLMIENKNNVSLKKCGLENELLGCCYQTRHDVNNALMVGRLLERYVYIYLQLFFVSFFLSNHSIRRYKSLKEGDGLGARLEGRIDLNK